MVVRLRFALHGTRNNRIQHLVAINQRQRRDGKPLELLAIYNPRVNPQDTQQKTVEWSPKRIRYWLDVGALPSKSVVKFLEMGKILEPGSPYHPKSYSSAAEATSAPVTAPST